MTTVTLPGDQTAVPWIAVEGVNGVGKTYLAGMAARALGDRCLLLGELPDAPQSHLHGQVIAALRGTGDPFLRIGTPRTETLLLTALQVHRHESAAVRQGQVVLEDRGPHTVAAYQAAILSGEDAPDSRLAETAQALLAMIASWRQLPGKVLLVTDDAAASLARFEARAGRPARHDEKALMRRASRAYESMSEQDPGRFQVIDRRLLDEEQCVAAITSACDIAAVSISGKACPADASR